MTSTDLVPQQGGTRARSGGSRRPDEIFSQPPPLAAEALECLGGSGYVEESLLPRLYREAPLNSIWEGSGNVICLDVLRAMARTPEALGAFLDEVGSARGADARLDRAVAELEDMVADPRDAEARARRIVERMAIVLQASLLVRQGNGTVAEAFCASRLTGDHGRAFGTPPAGLDYAEIIEPACPQVG